MLKSSFLTLAERRNFLLPHFLTVHETVNPNHDAEEIVVYTNLTAPYLLTLYQFHQVPNIKLVLLLGMVSHVTPKIQHECIYGVNK